MNQPHIPLVPKKSVEQQDVQALHRARQRLVNHRTALARVIHEGGCKGLAGVA
jgi:transposase